uniref:Uncharacterized protein n=1 Tax=Arundo donax TaxID=35708 RepID=A0A0A9G7Q4_ARUDO
MRSRRHRTEVGYLQPVGSNNFNAHTHYSGCLGRHLSHSALAKKW